MRSVIVTLMVLVCGYATAADVGTTPQLEPQEPRGELQVEIRPPATDLVSTGGEISIEVEGVASTIGGVRFIDMMLLMDTSGSLKQNDPDDYRTAAAIGLIESISPKSDMNVGVVAFSGESELIQPLTADRGRVTEALRQLKRSGGTNLAAGITAALDELRRNARPESSRVIVLFTDGRSNADKAREAARASQAQGVTIQTMLLGEDLKGGFLLGEIAETTGGGFVWVLDPADLPEAFLNLRTTGVDSVTLSVNGSQPIPARLTGGAFSGTVPLAVGENRIVALATSLDEQTRESVVNVTVRDASCARLEVAARNDGQPALSLNERAVEIVVDASRSMWGQIDGKSKMAIAQETLDDAATWLPDDLNLALRAYGNASPSDANNCADSTLLVPFGVESRSAIRQAISALRPHGQTPIAYALNRAADDFGAPEHERAIVLVTDGIESCGGDPVAAARTLGAQGITIHVIGFGLGNAADEDAASLQSIAMASGGQYLSATNAAELKRALEVTVGTRYRVVKEDAVVARGVLGSSEPLFLPMGDYRIEFDSKPAHEVPVSLAASDDLTLTLEKSGGVVSHAEQRDRLQPTSCEDAIAAMKGIRQQPQPAVSRGHTVSSTRRDRM